ncbi:hypothetical protein BP6252_11723 [Coleophoma cylindrospora]|uniref:FAS1 domain-containing protein n=1 Tax=Coleophoma cylindrospora TaxID=1849047 RepID=A0A3D8QKW0_9HELO|nr:hypothetical protein BP6252_11723 [Coleophoma cylindrospora]
MRSAPVLSTFTLLTVLTITRAKALPEPQNAAQTTAAVDALSSYVNGLQTDPGLLSLASALVTSPSDFSQLLAVQASLQSDLLNSVTPASNFLAAVPTQFQGVISSIYNAELQILSVNGFTSTVALQPATSSESSAIVSVTTSTNTKEGITSTGTSTITSAGKSTKTTSTGSTSAGSTGTGSATGTAASSTSKNAAPVATQGLIGAAGVAAGLVGIVVAL